MNTKELAESILDGSLHYHPDDDVVAMAKGYLELHDELKCCQLELAKHESEFLENLGKLPVAVKVGKGGTLGKGISVSTLLKSIKRHQEYEIEINDHY